MAGPIPTYLAAQTAAQTAFSVPFGLITLVNNAITAATAAGEFNVTVDCSFFTAEDVSNLRIYLDSQGYIVEFAKDPSVRSLNIDWGRFRDEPGTAVTVYQGTIPWIIAGTVDQGAPGATPWLVTGTVTTSPDVNIHDAAGNALTSTAGALDVNVVSFPGTISVTQGTSPWVISGSVSVLNFPAIQPVSGTVTALQGTSPWVVSGSIVTSPDVNIHDSAGNVLNSTAGSLDVNVTNPTIAVTQSGVWTTGRTWTLLNSTDSVNVGNFPAIQPVSGTVTALQDTSPWTVNGTVSATQSGTWTVQQGTPPWSVSVTNFPATQPVSGTVTALQGTSPWVISGTVTTSPDVNIHSSTGGVLTATGTALDVNVTNFPATVAVTQSTSPWVIAGTVTANIGTTGGLLLDSTFTSRINTLGQKAMAASTPVVIASDQSPIQVIAGVSTTGTLTTVARSNVSQIFLAANSSRKGATVYNDSGAVLYVKMGTTASVTDFTTRIASQTYYEVPFSYTGRIDGIWGSNGAGDARMTEFT